MQWLNRAMLRLHTENTLDREEKIMSEWLKTSLIDIVELIGGGTPKTSKAEYWGGNINWLSVKDFNNENRYVYSTEKTITEEGLNNSSTKLLRKDDIIISARGTVGELAMIPFPMAFNQSCYGIRAKEGIDSTFLYYLIKHSVRKLKAMTHGSVFDTITRDTFANIDVAIPDIEMQQRVAKMLANIDDKVENNQRINNNLEQQAQALFKKWFIDNPENVDWSAGTFRELIQSTLNGDWGKEAPTGNNTEKVYCIRGADIPEVKAGNKGKMPTRYILPKNLANKKLEAGDIVVEISGGSPTQSTGRCTAITQSLLDRYDSSMVCTNFCKAIKPKNGYSLFVYYYWQYLYEKGVFFSYENGTTGIKNLDFTGFIETEPIIVPTFDKVQAFDDYCKSIFNQVFANGKQSEQLSSLRDTLLPKLMSGELDVSNIEL